MKFLTICLIIFLIGAQDTCKEYDSFEKCVQSTGDQCRWYVQTSTCAKTSDYLFGCSPNLNKQACIKQLGTPSGTIAQCRFIQYCEYVPDFSIELCSNSLSKYACLGVTNIKQRCIWSQYQCKVIDVNENVQNNFISSLYSASVCSLINNYFIVHSSILWTIQNYYPNLLVMAENQVKADVGIISQVEESYADPKTTKLANNYVDSDNYFIFYRFQITKSSTASNCKNFIQYFQIVKIADRKREGCIAVEIADDDDFQLIVKKQLPPIGYNHIYCRYLLSLNSYQIFSNGQCTEINYPSDLLDQNFIKNNQITCTMMGYQLCSVFNYDNKCSLIAPIMKNQQPYEVEYSCIANKNSQSSNIKECPTKSYSAALCNSQKYCYVDTDSYECSNICFQNQISKSQCESYGCHWSDKFNSISDSISEYQLCEPPKSCNQPGLDQLYCSQLGSTCSWNSLTKQCQTVQDADLDILNCSDASNLMTCASIRRSDQLCFWSISTCYNVRDYTYLSSILSFSTNHIMNKNLCVSQTDDIFEYLETKKCQRVYDISQAKCSAQRIFNKQACFSISSQACYWSLNQQCLEFTNTNQLCSTLININPIACQKAQQPMDSKKQCIYNQQNNSCIEVLKESISCNLLGVSNIICLNLIDKCQWINSKCQSIAQKSIDQYRCDLLIDVSSAVCQSYSRGFCQFEIYKGQYHCFTNSIQQTSCDISYNGFVCQNSTAQCYFTNNICTSLSDKPNLLTQLECEYNFLSKSACLAITTLNQPCYWDTRLNRCRLLQSSMTTCNQYDILSNLSSCSALETQINKILTKDAFCEVENTTSKCVSNINTISDCGSTSTINIHRCVAYTSNRCYFDQYRCWETSVGNLENIILNQISCKQANKNLCQFVTKPQEFCIFINSVVGLQNDIKCISSSVTSSNCGDLKQGGNPNYCSQAQDLCMFVNINGITQCQVPSQNLSFDCNNKNLGLSKKACIQMTKGVCMFLNSNQCVPFNYYATVEQVTCEKLNKLACQQNTLLTCLWNSINFTCSQSVLQADEDCPSTTRPDTNKNYISWAYCSQSTGKDCIGNLNTCSRTLPNPMPCDVIGTNKQSCLSDQANYVCEFYDGKCRYYQPRLCEGAINIQQCYSIITPGQYCVFNNQKCYNLQNPIECDYLYTNYNFCAQFSDCVWDKVNYRCKNQYQYKELLQNLPDITGPLCDSIQQPLDCIFSNSYSCKFDYATSKCMMVDSADPILFQGDFYNLKSCVSKSYQYTLTKTGGFCSQLQSVKCSDLLTKQLCTTHINDTLQCFWLNTCQSKLTTQLTCNDIKGLPVNYPLCKALSGNNCIYDLNNNKCKPIINAITNCSDPLVTSLVQCAYLVRGSCIFKNDICLASGGGFDQDLNKFGCISLVNDFYYFDDLTWQCKQITTGDDLYGCENLNYDACIQKTSLYYCRWNNNQCQEDNKMQSCTDLNQNNCLLLEKTSEICYWNNNKCNKAASDYIFTIEQRSLSYCSSQIVDNVLINSSQNECEHNLVFNDPKYSIQKFVQLPACSGLGLNKQACQQNTLDLTCVWIDSCQDAILDQHLCVYAATQKTCLQLRTNQQFCQWNPSSTGGSCTLTTQPTTCATAFTQFSCQSVMQEKCQWDSQKLLCSSLAANLTFSSCDASLSKLACTQVFSSDNTNLLQCTFKNNQCSKLSNDPIVCSQIVDFQTCMNYTKIKIYCQWMNNKCTTFPKPTNKILCPLFPLGVNINVCGDFSEDLCYFNQNSNTCSNKFDSYFLSKTDEFKNFNEKLSKSYLNKFQSIVYSEKCEQLSAQQCTQSRVKDQYCQLLNNMCITITNLNVPCNNLNIYACINSTQNGCFWKQDQCYTYDNSIQLKELTNVNSIVCSSQTSSQNTHLYRGNSCYSTSDLSQAKCTDQGIDRVTCLQLKQSCTFVNNKCQNFVKSTQVVCSDYQSVTLSVCQQIQDLACQKKDDNCDNFIQVTGMKIDSLSKLACLSYTESPVYWNGSCQLLQTILQCGSSTLVNSLACVKIQTNRTPCIYDSVNFVCTPNFNKYSIKCTTSGLNLYGCAQVQSQACIFNNKCQEYTLTDQQCQNIKNVNSLACSIQLVDSCYYDESILQCSPSPIQPLCSLSGLNLAACGTNSICSWNNDLTKCQCASEITSNQCSGLIVTLCTGLCTYLNGQCVQSSCESQPISNCSGTLRGLKCYISNSQCFSASSCFDMYNTQCSNYGCDQAGNQCVPYGSNQVCQYLKDCNNTKCKLQQGVCRPLLCIDLNEDQCSQSVDCFYNNNICQDLLACSQLSNDADQCNAKQCNYQKYNIMSQQLYCTSKYCDVYGASYNICNGNEMNRQACVLNGLKCQTCESITDVCLCKQAKDICEYQNNKCSSILCKTIVKSLCEQTSNRCYWSKTLDICAKKCEKIIDQEDCEFRTNECYYNENTKLCYTASTTTPDVTNITDTPDKFGSILAILIYNIF